VVGGRSSPLINPVFAELEAVLFRRFLPVKDRPFDAFDLYNRAEAGWAHRAVSDQGGLFLSAAVLENSGEVQKCKQLDFVFRISAKNAKLIPRKN
jgi:hypothetical protein